jgi:hypothetical protein
MLWRVFAMNHVEGRIIRILYILLILYFYWGSRNSSDFVETGYGLKVWGFDSRQGEEIVLILKCPDRLWNPPSQLFSGYWGFFPTGEWRGA